MGNIYDELRWKATGKKSREEFDKVAKSKKFDDLDLEYVDEEE